LQPSAQPLEGVGEEAGAALASNPVAMSGRPFMSAIAPANQSMPAEC
jgi:hypothetical protein